MKINPYLYFSGQCEEAFKFYERCLGGKIEMMMAHRGSPAEQLTPPEWLDKILHARLNVGGEILMASDAPPGHQKKPQGFSVSIQIKELANAERIFKAMSENGSVSMPFQKTFFTQGFGMLNDQFGIPWMINCE